MNNTSINVSSPERVASVLAGATLAVFAARQRGWAGGLLAAGGGLLIWRGLSGHSQLYSEIGVDTARELAPTHRTETVVTINESPEQLYAFWRNFENLPSVMYFLESVEVVDDHRSRWRAKGPAGSHVEWEAELVSDIPNERIEWRSVPGAAVPNAGSVHFTPAPAGRGTEVRVTLSYAPPGGELGSKLAMLFGRAPEQEVREDLRRFKRMMETGEAITTRDQPSAHHHSLFAAFSESAR